MLDAQRECVSPVNYGLEKDCYMTKQYPLVVKNVGGDTYKVNVERPSQFPHIHECS